MELIQEEEEESLWKWKMELIQDPRKHFNEHVVSNSKKEEEEEEEASADAKKKIKAYGSGKWNLFKTQESISTNML